MSNSLVLKGFNNHFEEFLNDVQSVFPEDAETLALKNSFNLARKANPRLVIDVWYHHITLVYGAEIETGKIDYFLNKDFTEDITKVVGVGKEKIIMKINTLKKQVLDMGSENQAKSMKYIQNLCKLSRVYFAPAREQASFSP